MKILLLFLLPSLLFAQDAPKPGSLAWLDRRYGILDMKFDSSVQELHGLVFERNDPPCVYYTRTNAPAIYPGLKANSVFCAFHEGKLYSVHLFFDYADAGRLADVVFAAYGLGAETSLHQWEWAGNDVIAVLRVTESEGVLLSVASIGLFDRVTAARKKLLRNAAEGP